MTDYTMLGVCSLWIVPWTMSLRSHSVCGGFANVVINLASRVYRDLYQLSRTVDKEPCSLA